MLLDVVYFYITGDPFRVTWLAYNGRQLTDDRTLDDYSIGDAAIIFVVSLSAAALSTIISCD